MDDLRSQLITNPRKLVEGGRQTPLVEFTGTLAAWEPKHDSQYDRVLITFSFTDVNVIESVEPYDFPIAEITIPFSARQKSLWGIFLKSIATEGEDVVTPMVGQTLHMRYTEGHMLWNGQEKKETARSAWQLVTDGQSQGTTGSTSSPIAHLVRLLDGSTEAAFMQVALRDEVVRSKPSLAQAILHKTLIPAIEAASLITKDQDDVYHLAVEPDVLDAAASVVNL